MQVDDLLRLAVERGASDLHLKVGSPPLLRVDGALQPVDTVPALGAEATAAAAASLMSPALRRHYEDAGEVDFALSVSGLSRFRCHVFRQRGTTALVLRLLPRSVPTIDEMLLPPVVGRLAEMERGLLLVTGTSGSGKTTTLAAMIRHINATRRVNIITIEDPIEYMHRDDRAIVSQREVSADTRSFGQALRSALRQDPDVILVGEMRDRETIETALIAAETGHFVLSTLHTLDAAETINRIVSSFPVDQHGQIRLQLASVLKAVVSLRLLPRADTTGRCPAVEVLVVTPFVQDAILEPGRAAAIRSAIQTGRSQYGMQSFDDSLYDLYRRGLIALETGLRAASSADEFRLRVEGITASTEVVAGDIVNLGR
jgi:twitching motility protein PilT